MQMRRFTQLPGLCLAILLSLLVGSTAAEPMDIVGTWDVTVRFPECTTACPCPGSEANIPIQGMHQYQPHGALLEIPSTVFRGPGVGSWERVSKGQFAARFKFFFFDSEFVRIGSEEVTSHIRLTGPDNFEATGTFDLFEPDGDPVQGSTGFSINAIATRFQ